MSIGSMYRNIYHRVDDFHTVIKHDSKTIKMLQQKISSLNKENQVLKLQIKKLKEEQGNGV